MDPTTTAAAILAAIGCIFAAVASARAARDASRAASSAAEGATQTASALAEATQQGPGTDAQLLERLEATERRVEAAVDDINRRYRKLAQERRHLARLIGEDDDDQDDDGDDGADVDQEELAALRQQLLAGAGQAPAPAKPAAAPAGRQRLVPKTRR